MRAFPSRGITSIGLPRSPVPRQPLGRAPQVVPPVVRRQVHPVQAAPVPTPRPVPLSPPRARLAAIVRRRRVRHPHRQTVKEVIRIIKEPPPQQTDNQESPGPRAIRPLTANQRLNPRHPVGTFRPVPRITWSHCRLRSWLSVITDIVVFFFAYAYRIRVEETALVSSAIPKTHVAIDAFYLLTSPSNIGPFMTWCHHVPKQVCHPACEPDTRCGSQPSHAIRNGGEPQQWNQPPKTPNISATSSKK